MNSKYEELKRLAKNVFVDRDFLNTFYNKKAIRWDSLENLRKFIDTEPIEIEESKININITAYDKNNHIIWEMKKYDSDSYSLFSNSYDGYAGVVKYKIENADKPRLKESNYWDNIGINMIWVNL